MQINLIYNLWASKSTHHVKYYKYTKHHNVWIINLGKFINI